VGVIGARRLAELRDLADPIVRELVAEIDGLTEVAERLVDSPPVDLEVPPEQYERIWVYRLMSDCDGCVSEAARRWGIHRQSLQRKLQRLAGEDQRTRRSPPRSSPREIE
jgi:ActR/RegA family two-component response regulator